MLRSAVSNAAPDVLDNVLHACDHEKGKVIYMEKKKNRGFTAFAAVAAVFVLLIAGIFIAKNNGLGTSSNALAAVVSLDVNPSIELKVDKDEDVISATGLNADGKKVLEGMDLEHTALAGLAAGSIAMESSETINPALCAAAVKKRMEQR